MQGTPLFQNAPPERFEIHPRAERPLEGVSPTAVGDLGALPLKTLPRAKAALGTGQFGDGDVRAKPCLGVFLFLYPADPHRIAREPRHITQL